MAKYVPKIEFPKKIRTLDEDLSRIIATSVEDLDFKVLKVRAYNCINAANIETLGELATKTTNEVLGWKNAGPGTVERINKALEPFGLALDMEFVSQQPVPTTGEEFPCDEWAI